MGRDNHPKERQLRQLERKLGRRAGCDRILIVSEGGKTEPNYFEDIRRSKRLPIRNITVSPGDLGTQPIQVVQYAKALFENGDVHKGIQPRAFEQIFAVFDRDDHPTYFDALHVADSLDRKLRNDLKQAVSFKAIASVPCFELWLLLHFEDILTPIHRNEVILRLNRPGNIPGYTKGAENVYAITHERLQTATQRAERLAARFTPYSEPEPYTGIIDLVKILMRLQT